MSETLFVLSKGMPGREDDYTHWYETQHLADMKAVPGVVDGHFYTFAGPVEGARWLVGARFPVDRPVATAVADALGRAAAGEMKLTDAMDGSSILMLGAEAAGERVVAEGTEADPRAALFVTLFNATDGQEAALADWYDHRHIPDLLAVPGVIAAQRFRLAPETAGKPSPWRYMAHIELAAARAIETIAEVRRRAGTDAMPLSPALARDGYQGVFVFAA